MDILILVVLGLCFGSFVNAYVWRVHKAQKQTKGGKGTKAVSRAKDKYSLLHGRSMCPDCEHELAAKDLIPVVSWLSLKGKCRYCRKPISAQYPVVELLTSVLFVISYLSWPNALSTEQWVYLGFWLSFVVSFMALSVYDLKWMLLPNRMLLPLAVLAVAQVVVSVVWQQSADPLISAAWGAVIGGGLFYVLFQISKGKWIGGGDVKLGAVLGLIVGGPMNGILLLFVASLVGTLFALPLLVAGKAKRSSKLPFGPFLIISAFVVGLYGQRIADWYNQLILL